MIALKKFKKADKELLTRWFSGDQLGKRFLSSYAATEDFLHLVDFKKRHLWIATEDETPVGFFDFEIESPEKGYLVFYIAPEFRGKGFGKAVLDTALHLTEVKSVGLLEGGVEKDNTTSQKILEKAGFTYTYTDKDGMLMYQRRA